MANCAIVGINWGDEGKGRMVDLLTKDFEVVVRFQGGGNAGHTVINEHGKFALHLLPSGIFREGVVNILGNGVAVDPESLVSEMDDIISKGVPITPDNLMISDRASLLLPWHRLLDELEEARLADKKYGSTKQGIAPFYSDKFQKKTVLAGELLYPKLLRSRLKDLLEWKNLTIQKVYGAEGFTFEALENWIDTCCERIKPFVKNTGAFLKKAQDSGKRILFEAQLGSLKDIDFGIHPYTTSSNTLAAYAPIGSGLPGAKIDEVIGVVKAYSTCVGEGPFVCEMFGPEADKLREEGFEYGAKTGRPRRVGPIDIVATRYGVEVQAATAIALTKLDVLSYMDRIPVCTRYELDGGMIDEFPFPAALDSCRPVIEYFPGWKCDISACRTWEELPEAAKNYVLYIEKQIGCFIKYVSVGAERDSMIIRE
ncbi:MAG: adenylosuccinate synthase [Clostridia bacterium]|nr:adenylosuccinate synthase [Clostridia bacterium]